MNNINYIELFILNTLAFFDLFDYPLTLSEIHRYLYSGGMKGGSFSMYEIKDCLKTSEILQKVIAPSDRGFYFFKNRDQIVDLRLERYKVGAQKYKLARRAITLFRYMPFVKLVAVCNSLSYFNARKESDIDFFVVTAPKRLWLTRFILVGLIAILGLRPPKNKTSDKVCLSFYVSEDSLELAKAKIFNDDIYFNFWLALLEPVYERESCFGRLIEANPWVKDYFPNYQPKQSGWRLRHQDSQACRSIYESKEYFLQGKFGDWLEKKMKKWQLERMSLKKKDISVLNDTRVIISDSMLKLHDNDRRLEYLNRFEEKINSLLK